MTFNQQHVNGHCQSGTTSINWPVKAREGWRIDVESVTPETIRPVHVSSKASYGGITGLTSNGFTVTGSVANDGDCIKVLGKVVASATIPKCRWCITLTRAASCGDSFWGEGVSPSIAPPGASSLAGAASGLRALRRVGGRDALPPRAMYVR